MLPSSHSHINFGSALNCGDGGVQASARGALSSVQVRSAPHPAPRRPACPPWSGGGGGGGRVPWPLVVTSAKARQSASADGRGARRPSPAATSRRQRQAPHPDEGDVDADELLRELNSADLDGVDPEWTQEQDDGEGEGEGSMAVWGTDDIEAFARARAGEEGVSLDDDDDSWRQLARPDATPNGACALCDGSATVLMQPLFASRNSAIVTVLRSFGRTVLVDDGVARGLDAADAADADFIDGVDGGDGDDGGDGWVDVGVGGSSGGASGVSMRTRQRRAARDEFEPPAVAGGGSGGSGGSASADWYRELEASGFSIQAGPGRVGGSAAGSGVFLERTSRRRRRRAAARGSAAAASAAASTVTPQSLSTSGLTAIAPPVDDTNSLPSYKRGLRTLEAAEQLLDAMCLLHPYWAANGCYLVHLGSGQVPVDAPSPAAAASALRSVASLVRSQRMGKSACMELCDDTRVQGLVECLRVAPPRLLPEQAADRDLQVSLSTAARSYWLGGGSGGGGGRVGGARSSVGDPIAAVASSGGGGGVPPPSDGDELAEGYAELLKKYTSGGRLAGANVAPAAVAGAVGVASGGSSVALHARALAQAKADAFVGAVWALSVLGGPTVFEAETEALMRVARLGEWRLAPGDIANVAWALANARHFTPRLKDLEAAVCRVGGLRSMTPAESSRVLWAFATLQHQPLDLLQGLSPEWSWQLPSWRRVPRGAPVCGTLRDYTPTQLSSTLWALACLQQTDSAPFRSAWAELKLRGSSAYASQDVPALSQLWQAALAVKLEASWAGGTAADTGAGAGAIAGSLASGTFVTSTPAAGGGCGGKSGSHSASQAEPPLLGLPDEADPELRKLLARARQTFLSSTTALRKKVHSSYQRGIANTLTRLRTMHVLEDNSCGYAVDVSLPGARIAIEADGPTHVARTDEGHMLGATAMKRRHLQAMGWSVINVTFTTWDALGGEQQREAFLRDAISDALDTQIAPAGVAEE